MNQPTLTLKESQLDRIERKLDLLLERLEKKPVTKEKAPKGYPPEFETMWKLYPSRGPGCSNPKKNAYNAPTNRWKKARNDTRPCARRRARPIQNAPCKPHGSTAQTLSSWTKTTSRRPWSKSAYPKAMTSLNRSPCVTACPRHAPGKTTSNTGEGSSGR